MDYMYGADGHPAYGACPVAAHPCAGEERHRLTGNSRYRRGLPLRCSERAPRHGSKRGHCAQRGACRFRMFPWSPLGWGAVRTHQ
jgi:hypothetical protein